MELDCTRPVAERDFKQRHVIALQSHLLVETPDRPRIRLEAVYSCPRHDTKKLQGIAAVVTADFEDGGVGPADPPRDLLVRELTGGQPAGTNGQPANGTFQSRQGLAPDAAWWAHHRPSRFADRRPSPPRAMLCPHGA